jgi:hypothetical protein
MLPPPDDPDEAPPSRPPSMEVTPLAPEAAPVDGVDAVVGDGEADEIDIGNSLIIRKLSSEKDYLRKRFS